jgi:hypothetical protein
MKIPNGSESNSSGGNSGLGDAELDGLMLMLTDIDGLSEMPSEADGEAEIDSLVLGDFDADPEADGL